jgi:hypothetical protein
MSKTVVLVSCVKTKRTQPLPARALYCSSWFQKASAYAEQTGDAWYVLSAKYGLVHPDTVIAPYERSMCDLSASERREWARPVFGALQPILEAGDEVVILAGVCYRQHLVGPIRAMGCRLSIPMEGLGWGPQLHWLKEQRV